MEERFLHTGKTVVSTQTQRPTSSDKPSPPPPNVLLHEQSSHQKLLSEEDEMPLWLHNPHLYADLLFSNVVSTQSQSYVSQAAPPPPLGTTTQVGSSVIDGVSQTFLVPVLGRKEKAIQQHSTDVINDVKNPKEREETINELVSNKASMLDDAIEYIKSLQMQVQMMSMGGGGMMSMMYRDDMQRFMPHMEMGMNRPSFIPFPGSAFPMPVHISPPYPPPRYPFQNIQAFDPASNQLRFPGYLYPYSQFVGPQQMQQPPPLQNQTRSQLSFNQASSSKEPEGQENKTTS